MTELTFLALLQRLMNWGLAPLIATRTVAADAAALQRLLCNPANQLRLLAPRPRGLAARTRATASRRIITVELLRGERTLLWLTWILSAGRGTTEVDLAVQFQTRGLFTRLALVLGGRRWLAHRVDCALGRLGGMCARAAEDVVPAAAASACGGRWRTTRPARGPNRARHARRDRAYISSHAVHAQSSARRATADRVGLRACARGGGHHRPRRAAAGGAARGRRT